MSKRLPQRPNGCDAPTRPTGPVAFTVEMRRMLNKENLSAGAYRGTRYERIRDRKNRHTAVFPLGSSGDSIHNSW
jgi:hypothetical protein